MKRAAIACGGVAIALSCIAANPAAAGDGFAAGRAAGRCGMNTEEFGSDHASKCATDIETTRR